MKGIEKLLCCLFLCSLTHFLSAQSASETEEEKEPFPTWGHVAPFQDGMSVNFRVEKNRLHVYFIDAEEQLVAQPPVSRINARVNKRGDDPEFLPLRFNASSSSFTNPKFIRRPFIMSVNMTLIGQDGKAASSFQFFLNQKENGVEDLEAAAAE
ncbi:MAG: hypothetical protein ACPGN3_10600 [Opitutales bacterium]